MGNNKYYKHPQYGMVFGVDTLTPIGRLSWPSLVVPKAAPPAKEGEVQGAPRYEVQILLDKTDVVADEFKTQMEETAQEMIELFNEGKKAKISSSDVFNDGDAEKIDAEKYPYYAGHWILIARNKDQVKVVGKNKELLDPKTLTGGMKVRAVVQPLVTPHGVSYKLKAVQFIEDDGKKFGGSGSRDAVDLFEDCSQQKSEAPPKVAALEASATEEEKPKRGRPPGPKAGRAAALDLL